MRRLIVISAFAAAVLIAGTRPASAVPIIVAESFDAGPTGLFGSFAVTPFDPALGTLDSVNISISGVLALQVQTLPNFIFTPFGPIPQASSFDVEIGQTFRGELGKYFEFTGPATFHATRPASGTGELITLTTAFSYGMTFNAGTDIAGLVFPSVSSTLLAMTPPLGGVTGQRSDFLETLVPHDVIDLFQSVTFSGARPDLVMLQAISAEGAFIMTYNYTPAAPPADPVPEPTTMLLVGSGIAVTAVRRRMTR